MSVCEGKYYILIGVSCVTYFLMGCKNKGTTNMEVCEKC